MRALNHLPILFSIVLLPSCNNRTVISGESPEINQLKKGEEFTVILPEDHTKGENWVVKDDFNHDQIQHVNSVWHGNAKGIYFNFKALSKGKDTLNLIEIRMRDTVDTKQFIVEIGDN